MNLLRLVIIGLMVSALSIVMGFGLGVLCEAMFWIANFLA